MARNHRILWSWESFSRAIRLDRDLRLWSRFPVELAPDLIVSPHLFDWPPSAPRGKKGRDVYTCAAPPDVVVFSVTSAAHRSFLEEEVVPRVHAHVRVVALVDFEADQVGFAPLRADRFLPAEHLAPLLRIAWGRERLPHNWVTDLGASPEAPIERMLFGPDDVRPEDRARCEAHPLRLWEAFFWRGHAYRYELIDGEIPLVGDLHSPLAANRTLMQLVRDAERLEGLRADEHQGWIRCGRFRIRQAEQLVEVRARLTPADVRAAFLPQTRVSGDEQLPTLLGALMAGGDNGKTELWNGYTWSTVELASPAQTREAARALAEAIARWTEAKATIIERDALNLPEAGGEEWYLVPHERWLTVYVPFAREDCLPWEVSAGGFFRPQPQHDQADQDGDEEDDPSASR